MGQKGIFKSRFFFLNPGLVNIEKRGSYAKVCQQGQMYINQSSTPPLTPSCNMPQCTTEEVKRHHSLKMPLTVNVTLGLWGLDLT